MLSPQIQAEILSLHFSKHKGTRGIARALGINRKSVRRVVERGSVVLVREKYSRASRLDPYKEKVIELLKEDPETTGGVVLQRIRDQGYDAGVTILRNFMREHRLKLQQSKNEAFYKMDFAAGEAAQVDWGEFGNVFGDGVKIHCFVMVLCYSRLLYIEFTRSEKFEELIRCHENAIRYFDGLVPAECWYDNMPTVVSKRMRRDVQFNTRFLAYAGHHHFMPHACNLGKGNEKGRVENGVKYIRSNFWHNRKFEDFEDLCAQAAEWRDQTANVREHGAMRKIPKLVFEHDEKAHLLRANPTPFETDEILVKPIPPSFHITYESNQYSVPWTLVGCVVSVRVDASEIRVYFQEQLVAKHVRSYLKYQRPFTTPEHEQGLNAIKTQGNSSPLHMQMAQLENYGPTLKQYLQCLRYSNRSLRREVSRLLGLGTIYGEKELVETVESFLKRGIIGADHVEQALKGRNSGVENVRTAMTPAKGEQIACASMH